MKKIGIVVLFLAVLMSLVGCGHIADGPGMVNTEYEQGDESERR